MSVIYSKQKEGDPKVQFHKDKLINSKLFMVIDIAESLITILTICNFFENLIYFWVTLFFSMLSRKLLLIFCDGFRSGS